jgi:hypothetical protein
MVNASISVFWNAASASAKINTEARSFFLSPSTDYFADVTLISLIGSTINLFPVRRVTGERQSVADRVAE